MRRTPLRHIFDVVIVAAICWAGFALFASGRSPSRDSAASANGSTIPLPPDPAVFARSLIGTTLDDLELFGANDTRRRTTFGVDGRPTVILAFRSDCRYCEQTAAAWRQLTLDLSTRARFVAVTVDDPRTARRWTSRHQLPVRDIWVPVDETSFRDQWRLVGVPATVTVDSTGRVTYAHFGVVRAEQASAISAVVRTP